MRKLAIGVLRLGLAFAGVAVVSYVVLFGTMMYQHHEEPVVDADDPLVRGVLSQLRQPRTPFIHSYQAPANWAGDYEKLFAIRLAPGAVASFRRRPDAVRGDQARDDMLGAVRFALTFTRDQPWFPSREVMLSATSVLSMFSVRYQGSQPDSAHLAVLDTRTAVLYFVAAKM